MGQTNPADMMVGQNIQLWRFEKGITAAAVSKHLRISLRHLAQVEAGEVRLGVNELYELACFLNVRISDFFTAQENTHQPWRRSLRNAERD